MVSQIFAIVIFVLMFALIIMDKIPRHWVTLGCGLATIVIVFAICMKSPSAIMETLNVKSIFTLGIHRGRVMKAQAVLTGQQ